MDVFGWDLLQVFFICLISVFHLVHPITNANQLSFTCHLGTGNLNLLLSCLVLVFDFYQQLSQACCPLTYLDVSEIACQES